MPRMRLDVPEKNLALPTPELVDVIVDHQGIISHEQLLHHFSPAKISSWRREQLLLPAGEGHYTLAHLTAYVDGLVLAQWAIPGGIIGKLSALVYHELSVALPTFIDVSLPPGWQGTLPADLGIRPLVVPPGLRDYGVMTGYPSPPGTVPVQLYTPAVALAQVWADQAMSEQTKLDGWMMYWSFLDEEDQEKRDRLQQAFERYDLSVPAALELA